MPVMDKPTFLRTYAHVMDNQHDLDVLRKETPFLSVMFAMFACAANLVQDPRLTSERQDEAGMGMIYYERYFFQFDQKSGSISKCMPNLIAVLGLSFCNILVTPTFKLPMYNASF